MHINQLPVEILCKVFLNSLPARDEMLKGEVDPIYSISTPLYISHVCQHWREVSLAYSDLWSHLFIKYFSYDYPGEDNDWSGWALEIFSTWLERTRNRPMNFSIHCHLMDGEMGGEESEHRAFELIITRLLLEQERWRDVDFWWDCVKVSSGFRGIHASKMPELVSLSSNHAIIAQDKKLAISRVNVSSSRKLASLMLPGCCNLSFKEDKEFSNSETSLAEKRYPARTSDLPSLKWLPYYGEQEDDHDGRPISSRFILNALPPLTVLDVAGFVAHENTVVPALRLLTALEELRIRYFCDLSPELFRVLTPDNRTEQGSNSIVCPSLRKLCLINVNDPDGPGIEMESMDEMEVKDETEYEEATEIMDEDRSESQHVEYQNEVQNDETVEQRQVDRAEFFGALCTMAERRHKFLNTFGHIWFYHDDESGWLYLMTEFVDLLHCDKIIEEWYKGLICIESSPTGDKPPNPTYLCKIATSLPH